MKSIFKRVVILTLIALSPLLLWAVGGAIVGVAGLPWLLDKAFEAKFWSKTPAYMQMSNATYKIEPELSPIPFRWNNNKDSAFVPSDSDEPFRVFKTLTAFTIRCHKDYNCVPSLSKLQGSIDGVVFFEDSAEFNTRKPFERTESFDQNFDYFSGTIERYGQVKVEFSLISKEPLFFDSYLMVLCGPDTREAHLESRLCYFEAPKSSPKDFDTVAFAPGVRFILSSIDAQNPDVEISDTNVYHPELWADIAKALEQIIRDSKIDILETQKINAMAVGHWQADRHSTE